jgi:hypothetical protein
MILFYFFGATEEQAIFCEECIGYLCFLYKAINESINVVYLLFSDMLRHREEMIWLQSTRIDWLREGDNNTKKITIMRYGEL